MNVRLIFIWTVSFVLLASECTKGAFLNGVETFDGQVVDTSTWQARYKSAVVQSDALTIPSGEVVTTKSLVPVGGGVRVDVVMSGIPGVSNNYPGVVTLLLTTASSGTGTGYWCDSFAAELDLMLWAGNTHPGCVTAGIVHTGSASGMTLGYLSDSDGAIGHKFTFEINRQTSQQYKFSVLDSSGDVVGNGALSTTSFLDMLYIDLHTDGGTTATFDNVTIIPEPSTLTILGVGAVSLLIYAWPKRKRAGVMGFARVLQFGSLPKQMSVDDLVVDG